MQRYHLTTYGCQMNAHDSERIKGMLEELGLGEAADAETPLLVLHGTQDQMVPYAMGQKIFEAATVPKTFVTVPDGDHTHNLEKAIRPFSDFLASLPRG